MSQRYRRYSLKSKNVKVILNEVSERLKVNVEAFFGSKVNVEVVEADFGQIYLVNGKPLFFNAGRRLCPRYFSKNSRRKRLKWLLTWALSPMSVKAPM